MSDTDDQHGAFQDHDGLPDEPTSPHVEIPPTGTQKPAAAGEPSTDSSADKPSLPSPKKRGIADTVKGVFAAFDPVGKIAQKEFNKTFHQVVQIAGEKFGKAEVTQLPKEYTELESQVDRLKAVHENLAKVAAMQVQPGATTDVKFAVYGALNNVVDNFGTTQDPHFNSVNAKLRTVTVNTQNPNKAIADEFANAGTVMGDAPLGAALLKASDAQRKIGEARTKMTSEISEKFIKRIILNLETTFRNVNHYRRCVYNSRIKLDALKARARNCPPEKEQELSDELQVGQVEFNSLVTLTIDLMKAAVTNNEPLAALADMMATMLVYFQTGYEMLSELAPEIDSLKVAQEALQEKTVDS